jgi:hypothetical protein
MTTVALKSTFSLAKLAYDVTPEKRHCSLLKKRRHRVPQTSPSVDKKAPGPTPTCDINRLSEVLMGLQML